MTRDRNFSPWAYWALRLQATELDEPFPVGDPSRYPEARARVRGVLDELLAPWPPAVPLNLETTGSVDCGTYVRERIVFDSEAAMSVAAYLLVPKDRRAPGSAVLAQHGHGAGKDAVCGVVPSEYGDDYAHRLAQRGHLVLAPDLRGFGERRDEWFPPELEWCDWNLVAATAAGANPLTGNLWDLMRALDVLSAHPLVDPARIGMVGFSYGGTVTLLLAALDARVRVAGVSGAFSDLRQAHTVPLNLCGSQVLPGMLHRLDHVDLGALIAPRPLFVENGEEDVIWPADGATRELARLRLVYEQEHAADRVGQHVFEGDHRFCGERLLPFIDRGLRG